MRKATDKVFLTEACALNWIFFAPYPKRGDYIIEQDIFSGTYTIYLTD